jgi:hypothetical protein
MQKAIATIAALLAGCAAPVKNTPVASTPPAPPTVSHGANAPTTDFVAPQPPARNVLYLESQALYQPALHRPPEFNTAGIQSLLFKICVGVPGQVTVVRPLSQAPAAELEAVAATLRTWRYRPQPIAICFIANFVFEAAAR